MLKQTYLNFVLVLSIAFIAAGVCIFGWSIYMIVLSELPSKPTDLNGLAGFFGMVGLLLSLVPVGIGIMLHEYYNSLRKRSL